MVETTPAKPRLSFFGAIVEAFGADCMQHCAGAGKIHAPVDAPEPPMLLSFDVLLGPQGPRALEAMRRRDKD